MTTKPKLLVVELWALGDLALATPFLNAAVTRFEVTLLASPRAQELQPHLWPNVRVVPFTFPWTAFQGKYRLNRWPWRKLAALVKELRHGHFDLAASARWDPRDHLLLWRSASPRRLGFPRRGSQIFLTESLPPPPPAAHRYENWRILGRHLGLDLPAQWRAARRAGGRGILVHCGAAQSARIWPLERFHFLVGKLREHGYQVQIACDPAQRSWWQERGQTVASPASIAELVSVLKGADAFIGNDSGPGHLAAILGLPTFTLFGNQFPARFHPLHPDASWMEGAPCPYKPCYDSCRFPIPECLYAISQEQAWPKVKEFAAAATVL